MQLPQICHAGGYFHVQKAGQTITRQWLGMGVSGRIRSKIYAPDGTLFREFDHTVQPQTPALYILTPGFSSEFEYGPNRENYVIGLDFPALTYDRENRCFMLDYDGLQLPMADTLPLAETEVSTMRETFQTIIREHASAIPYRQLTAAWMTLDLLRRFFRQPADDRDPVKRFRQMLVDDPGSSTPLEWYSHELGISRDTLRRKFFARYKITPAEYRSRLKLEYIKKLFSTTDMTLKEIAFAAGMKNPSHLSMFIRARCNQSASSLCREYRKF